MWDIKPGDEVVCVDALWRAAQWRLARPGPACPLVEGQVYTVDGFRESDGDEWYGEQRSGIPCVILREVRNPEQDDGAFALARFRPVSKSRKGDGSAIETLRDIARRESMPETVKPKRVRA